MKKKPKGLSDCELRMVCCAIGCMVCLMFSRFSTQSYRVVGAAMTTSAIFSNFWYDVVVFCAGWFAVALFMWNAMPRRKHG